MNASEQARADSLADAETLRKIYRSHFRGARYSHTKLAAAETFGARVEDTRPWLGDLGLPFVWARAAARAAFKAVPGLRGDR